MSSKTRSPISMTWEELERCPELDRRSEKVGGTLLAIPNRLSHSQSERSSTSTSSVIGRNKQQQGTVQILKRQPNSDQCLSSNPDAINAQGRANTTRSLEERQEAYAEARARILGSSSSATKNQATPSPSTNGGGSSRRNSKGRPTRREQQQQQQQSSKKLLMEEDEEKNNKTLPPRGT